MQPDIEASIEICRAFNRWLEDDWGFAYQDRIFGVPFLTLSDLDQAVDELRVVPRPRRPRRLDPQRRRRSRADGTAVAGRSDVRRVLGARRRSRASSVTSHAGSDAHLRRDVPAARPGVGRLRQPREPERRREHADDERRHGVRRAHEAPPRPRLRRRPRRRTSSSSGFPRLQGRLHRERLHLGAVLLQALELPRARRRSTRATRSTSSIEHCWVAPFVEESVDEFAQHLPGRADPLRLRLAARRGLRAPAGLLRQRRELLGRRPAPHHVRERPRTHPARRRIVLELRARWSRSARAARRRGRSRSRGSPGRATARRSARPSRRAHRRRAPDRSPGSAMPSSCHLRIARSERSAK